MDRSSSREDKRKLLRQRIKEKQNQRYGPNYNLSNNNVEISLPNPNNDGNSSDIPQPPSMSSHSLDEILRSFGISDEKTKKNLKAKIRQGKIKTMNDLAVFIASQNPDVSRMDPRFASLLTSSINNGSSGGGSSSSSRSATSSSTNNPVLLNNNHHNNVLNALSSSNSSKKRAPIKPFETNKHLQQQQQNTMMNDRHNDDGIDESFVAEADHYAKLIAEASST